MSRTIRTLLAAAAACLATAVPATVTTAAGADTAAVADQLVAYYDGTTGNGISVRDMQTGAVTALLSDVRVAFPALSPDGTQVAYSAPGSGFQANQLWITAVDGSTPPRQLTTTSCFVQHIAWSADGTEVAFGCSEAWGPIVYVVNSATGDPINAAGGQFIAISGTSPSFSPDASKLAVQGDGGTIRVVDLTTNPIQGVTIADGVDPRWSPDGQKILYGAPSGDTLYSVNPDGTGATALTAATAAPYDNIESWAWAADGRTIIFTADTLTTWRSVGNRDLFMIDRNGTLRFPATPATSVDEVNVSVSGSLHATTPSAPTTVTATAPLSQHSISVHWSAPATDGGAPVFGYTAEASLTPTGTAVVRSTTAGATTATLAGLKLGTGYYVRVAARNAEGTGTWSTAVGPIVPRTATRTSLTSVTSSYVYSRGYAHVHSTVTVTSTGHPAAGALVALQCRPAGTSVAYRTVATATADSYGHVRFDSRRPSRNTQYRLLTQTHGPFAGSGSAGAVTTVHPYVTVALSRTTVAAGAVVYVAGHVLPDLTGRTVTVQRWNGTSWQRVVSTTLRTGSVYSVAVREYRIGHHSYRVVIPATTTLGAGTSPTVVLTTT